MWKTHADRRTGATTSRTFCADVAVSRDIRSRMDGKRRRHQNQEKNTSKKEKQMEA